MLWTTVVLASVVEAQISQGLNHLRFGCSQITIERLDPLVNPGLFPTPQLVTLHITSKNCVGPRFGGI